MSRESKPRLQTTINIFNPVKYIHVYPLFSPQISPKFNIQRRIYTDTQQQDINYLRNIRLSSEMNYALGKASGR